LVPDVLMKRNMHVKAEYVYMLNLSSCMLIFLVVEFIRPCL
jgi:hypothetical protein